MTACYRSALFLQQQMRLAPTLQSLSTRGYLRPCNPPKDGVFKTTSRLMSTVQSVNESLAARGYLRPHKQYTPPKDVNERLEDIFKKNLSSDSLSSGRAKFKVLNACFKEFNHSVPNSLLHEISTKDIMKFYNTTVDVRVPLDKFKSVELPPNIHIQYEYHRFHPETDTMHGGVSAFPKRSTIVTGLKYKKKYAGYTVKPKWH